MPLPSDAETPRPAVAGPKIILLDLQSTLSSNFRQMGTNPTPTRIRKEERYKPYLVDWLREVQQAGWAVHLFTVRNEDRKRATLESILAKADWRPDHCWFKTGESGAPPTVKSAYLDRLIPQLAPSVLYALESNPETRCMFKARGIPCCPISEEGDLPPLSEFALS